MPPEKPSERINPIETDDSGWNISPVPVVEQAQAVDYNKIVKSPLREKLLELAQAAISYLDVEGLGKGERIEQDPSHDYAHTLRVMMLAENILAEIGGDERIGIDRDVVLAAVAFHDLLTRPKKSKAYEVKDTDESAEYAADLLKEIGFTEDRIRKVQAAIKESSFVRGSPPERDEAKILFTADKLDQGGAIGVMRYASSGGSMRRQLYNIQDPFGDTGRKLDSYKYTLDALMDRLVEVERTILDVSEPGRVVSSPKAREIMERRAQFRKDFIDELRAEIREEAQKPSHAWLNETGATAIMKIFEKSGKEARVFYNPDDPFCEKRIPEPDKYPVDALVQMERTPNGNSDAVISAKAAKRRKKFLNRFLEEFKLEIEGK